MHKKNRLLEFVSYSFQDGIMTSLHEEVFLTISYLKIILTWRPEESSSYLISSCDMSKQLLSYHAFVFNTVSYQIIIELLHN